MRQKKIPFQLCCGTIQFQYENMYQSGKCTIERERNTHWQTVAGNTSHIHTYIHVRIHYYHIYSSILFSPCLFFSCSSLLYFVHTDVRACLCWCGTIVVFDILRFHMVIAFIRIHMYIRIRNVILLYKIEEKHLLMW